MAYTLTEVQSVLTNLKATYLALTQKHAASIGANQRNITYQQMQQVRSEIEAWEEREQALAAASSGPVPGVAHAQFVRHQ